MRDIALEPDDINLLEKIMPIVCLLIPWEIYFYSSYSSGWGIKFSVFYANFDDIYGTIFVDIFKQMSLLSAGGFLPSVRTLAWIFAAILCISLAIYELSKENINLKLDQRSTAYTLIVCGILTFISSFAVWNNGFKTLPIAPFFFVAFGYILLKKKSTHS